MRGVRSLVFVVVVLLAGASCGPLYVNAIEGNRARVSRLEIGMSREDVDRVMGVGSDLRYEAARIDNPWRVDAFSLEDGTIVRIHYYLTERPLDRARAQEIDLTPVVLENGRVVGWGWSYLGRATDRYRIPTPREQR